MLHGAVAVGDTRPRRGRRRAARRTRCATTPARTCSTGRCATSSGERARQAGSLVTPGLPALRLPVRPRRSRTTRSARSSGEVRGVGPRRPPGERRVDDDGRGAGRGRRRVLRREVRRAGAHDPGRGLQPRAVRRHALPGVGTDRRLRHHRRAEHRLGDAPHRGRHRAPPRTRSWRPAVRRARASGRGRRCPDPGRARGADRRAPGRAARRRSSGSRPVAAAAGRPKAARPRRQRGAARAGRRVRRRRPPTSTSIEALKGFAKDAPGHAAERRHRARAWTPTSRSCSSR